MSTISLLSGNFLKATVASNATMVLTSTTSSDTITYKLYADAAGTVELKPGIAGYYVNGTTSLLTLGGSGPINIPVYVKLTSAAFVAPGTYKGSVPVSWDWKFCSGIGALGACIGQPDQGSSVVGVINATINVQPKPPTVSVSVGAATWNAVEGTSNPKAIPGSKRLITLTVQNPDIVSVEADTLKIELATPSNMAIALDGDGTGGAVVRTVEGTPASSLTLTYTAPDSTTDDVDFSSNGGASWTAYPLAGDATTQAQVSRVRMRPHGSMAAGSSYSISVPYSIK